MKSLSASLDTDGSAGTDELITIYKEAYKEVLNSFDAKNPNWCEVESYKHITDKYIKLAENLKKPFYKE